MKGLFKEKIVNVHFEETNVVDGRKQYPHKSFNNPAIGAQERVVQNTPLMQ